MDWEGIRLLLLDLKRALVGLASLGLFLKRISVDGHAGQVGVLPMARLACVQLLQQSRLVHLMEARTAGWWAGLQQGLMVQVEMQAEALG